MASYTEVKVRLLQTILVSTFNTNTQSTYLPPRSFLLRLGSQLASWLGQDGSLGDDHNVPPTELLLQLSHNSVLDFLKSLQLGNWNIDDDSLLAGDIHFFRSSYVKFTQLSLEVTVNLQVNQSLQENC